MREKKGLRMFLLICWIVLSSFFVTFDQLDSSLEEIVQIKGFLYEQQDGRFILASQPNLKSCCLGKESLIKQQIIVEGHFKKVSDVVILEGILKMNPRQNEKGEYIQWYILQQPRLIIEEKQSLPWKSSLLLIGGILTLGIAFKRKGIAMIKRN